MTPPNTSDDENTPNDPSRHVEWPGDVEVESTRRGADLEIEGLEAASWVRDGLAAFGFDVRPLASSSEPIEGEGGVVCHIDDDSLERVSRALKIVLAPDALFLDLDGVLADVTDSYRRSIVETAGEFGVELSLEEVSRLKAEGDANNDWILVHRLLEERGIDVELEEVEARYEARYHGEGSREGLWRRETMIPDESLIEQLASRLPLGIVTGRTRRSADRFLEHTWIDGYVEACVCMEDAPRKPSPEPVELLASRMSVHHGWLVGDTPDDMLAARRASALPLGIVSPSDSPDHMRSALEEAGAARILSELGDLLHRLPD